MCINVAQIKLEHFFEELLLMMMEEYENAHLSDVDGAIIGPPPDIQVFEYFVNKILVIV
jgi:hypothetical protein